LAFQAIVILIGLIIGWSKRGSFWSIMNVRIRAISLLPLSYAAQYISINYLGNSSYQIGIVLSYVMLLLFCILNTDIPGLKWTFVGTALNFLVMSVNNFRMPAYLIAVHKLNPVVVPLLMKGHYGKSVAMTGATHLKFLADIFAIDVGVKALVSIGDLLFGIGLVIFIQHAMRLPKEVKYDEGIVEETVET